MFLSLNISLFFLILLEVILVTIVQVNIDECELKPCQNNGNCTDKINDYDCKCEPGFQGQFSFHSLFCIILVVIITSCVKKSYNNKLERHVFLVLDRQIDMVLLLNKDIIVNKTRKYIFQEKTVRQTSMTVKQIQMNV